MTPLEMIEEWERGCSCAPHDPAECKECTRGLIQALKNRLSKPDFWTTTEPGGLISDGARRRFRHTLARYNVPLIAERPPAGINLEKNDDKYRFESPGATGAGCH